MIKNLPAMWETWFRSLGWEGKGMAIHSSVLAWKISGTEKPGGLQSMGSQRVRHDRATNTFTFQPISLPVSAWSKSPCDLEGLTCYFGALMFYLCQWELYPCLIHRVVARLTVKLCKALRTVPGTWFVLYKYLLLLSNGKNCLIFLSLSNHLAGPWEHQLAWTNREEGLTWKP